jgi:protocatechuate 3,4-dioxygenase beta subunit
MNAWSHSRRQFLAQVAFGAVALASPFAFADELFKTPKQTEGPFYPDKLPLDTDNDLIVVNEDITAAVGEITYFTGRVLDAKGEPVRGVLVEIWQCDSSGVYLHTRGGSREKQDKHFQGFGRHLTGPDGSYFFRTIKPVPYPGRTPHIHVMVKDKGKELLTTQCYIKGNTQNEKDGIFRGLREEKAKEAVCADFVSLKGSKIGELSAKWDIVLGVTPAQA